MEAFFIIIIISDLTEVQLLLAIILAVLLFYWSCICFQSQNATFLLFTLFFPVFLFFLSSFFRLLRLLRLLKLLRLLRLFRLLGLLGLFRLLKSLFSLKIGFFLVLTLENRAELLSFFKLVITSLFY